MKRAVDLLGGIGQFIKPDERVLIKPNILTQALPEEGIDTHPEVVRSVIRLLKPVTKNIFCGDSPSVWGEKRDVDRCYEASGIKKVCQEEGVDLVYFTTARIVRGYPLTDWIDRCDRLISVPKFKTHGFTILTAGVKNLFGLVVGMYKMKIHRDNPRPEDLSRALVDIYEIKKPDLTVLDGVVAMEGQGPGSGGSLKSMELIAAAGDALSLDMILATVMGLLPYDIPTNREALRRGMTSGESDAIELSGEDIKTFLSKDFRLPKTTYLNMMPRWTTDMIKRFFWMRPQPVAAKCKACGLCQKSCPSEAIRLEDNRIVIDYKKCILCLCCQEICPQGAIDIKKNLIWELLTRLRG